MIIYATEVQTINSFLRLESLKEVYGLIWIFVPIFSLVLGIITGVLVIVWLEREISAGIQQRIGPEYAGPLGILQALADGTKLLFKEDLRPSRGNTPSLYIIYISIELIICICLILNLKAFRIYFLLIFLFYKFSKQNKNILIIYRNGNNR